MKHKFILLSAALLLIAVICSCSQVFEAGVSGTVKKEDGTNKVGIQDVNVYVFTNKDERDSEYTRALQASQDNTKYELSSSVVASKTVTNANGEFTVNKVVWETKKSSYGKTADTQKVYLLFQNDDYTPTVDEAMITSDSTNASSVNVIMVYNKEDVAISVTIANVSSQDTALSEARSLKYKLYVYDPNDESVKTDSLAKAKEDTTTITGSGTINVKFPKAKNNGVRFYLPTSGDNDTWEMTDKNGSDDVKYQDLDVASGVSTASTKLYMRSTDFTVPAFSGSLCKTTDDNSKGETQKYDGISLILYYSLDNENWVSLAPDADSNGPGKVQTTMTVLTNNPLLCSHGNFTGLGRSDSTVFHIADVKYSGTKRTVYFKIESTDEKVTGSYTFKYSDSDNTALGYIELN